MPDSEPRPTRIARIVLMIRVICVIPGYASSNPIGLDSTVSTTWIFLWSTKTGCCLERQRGLLRGLSDYRSNIRIGNRWLRCVRFA